MQANDCVDEASWESFPASDPPAFTQFHAGPPSRPVPPPVPWKTIALCIGVALAVAGVWMYRHR